VLGQVQQDRSGLEDSEVAAIVVDQNGDSAVWIEFEEPWFLRCDEAVMLSG
jgi:hypothetical protein